jgi:hypothetical protein
MQLIKSKIGLWRDCVRQPVCQSVLSYCFLYTLRNAGGEAEANHGHMKLNSHKTVYVSANAENANY